MKHINKSKNLKVKLMQEDSNKNEEVIDMTIDEAMELFGQPEPFESIGLELEKHMYHSRTLYLNDEVCAETIDYMTRLIHKWNMEDDMDELSIEDRLPITLYIASGGGDLLHGLTLVGAMENSTTPIITVSEGGICASMAFILFLAGHVRKASILTDFMYHTLRAPMDVSALPEMLNTVEYYTRLQDKLDAYILKKTSIDKKLLNTKRKSSQDWFIDSNKIVDFGIAHIVE